MHRIMTFIKQQSGDAIVLVSLSFMALMAMTGLVIDGGMLYMTKTHLQKAANATVLSSAQELTREDEEQVEAIAETILTRHEEIDSLKHLSITMKDRVTVTLEKPVDLAFSSLFGFDTTQVEVDATARLGIMGRAVGAAPLGIHEEVSLEFGTEYKLKVDSDEVDTGNFGILALDGPGAKEYEDDLRNGFSGELQIGEVVDTQTGNIAGKTRGVVNDLINECSNPEERDCARILLVPVYNIPPDHTGNQVKQVEITGFAYFYITEPMENNDSSITGEFIERADTGFEVDGAADKGAYSIRLTE